MSAICPITQEQIKDPITAPDYYTYERSALEQWLRTNPTSPMTRQPMRLEDLKTNMDSKADNLKADDLTEPLLPITITTTITHTNTMRHNSQVQSKKLQKMIILVCPVTIGVIILLFLIRSIT
jgi:U-box domain